MAAKPPGAPAIPGKRKASYSGRGLSRAAPPFFIEEQLMSEYAPVHFFLHRHLIQLSVPLTERVLLKKQETDSLRRLFNFSCPDMKRRSQLSKINRILSTKRNQNVGKNIQCPLDELEIQKNDAKLSGKQPRTYGRK